jgi:hypothetical protein
VQPRGSVGILGTVSVKPLFPLISLSLNRTLGAAAGLFLFLLPMALTSCSHSTTPATSETVSSRTQQATLNRAAREKERQQLDQIPPPSKSLYLAVRSQDAWANPFVSVDKDMLTLRIIMPDANPSPDGQGGLLRPANARKRTLQIRLSDLPDALTALPTEAWPYGRVVAIAEAPTQNKTVRPEIRRKVEATIQTLNDLGIVVDEWAGPSGGLFR